MVRVFVLILAVIASCWYVAYTLETVGPGYVWIYYNHYSIETTFWFFVAALIICVALLSAAFVVIKAAIYLLKNLGIISSSWGVSKAEKQLQQSRIEYLNGHWSLANEKFKKSFKKAKLHFTDVIMAAQAAMRSGDIVHAKHLAQQALTMHDNCELTVGLLDVDIAIAENNSAIANIAMAKLLRDFPKDKSIKEKGLRYYASQKQWNKAADVYHSMAKAQQKLFTGIYDDICGFKITQANHRDALKPYAKSLPTLSSNVQKTFIQQAFTFDGDYAEKILKQLVKQKQLAAIALFQTFKITEAEALTWLSIIEPLHDVIAEHECRADILAGVAGLNESAQLHNKAIDIYQQSLAIKPDADVLKAYCALLVKHKSSTNVTKALSTFNR